MLHRLVAADRVVLPPHGKGVTGARGCQRLETQVRKQPRGADIPWIGDDKCTVPLMQCAKGFSLLFLASHHPSLGCLEQSSELRLLRRLDQTLFVLAKLGAGGKQEPDDLDMVLVD